MNLGILLNNRGSKVLLLFPYYSRGTVGTLMQEGFTNGRWLLPESEALRLFIGAAHGLAALHAEGFAHRDIKVCGLCSLSRLALI